MQIVSKRVLIFSQVQTGLGGGGVQNVKNPNRSATKSYVHFDHVVNLQTNNEREVSAPKKEGKHANWSFKFKVGIT